MIKNEIFDKYYLVENKLITYGFRKVNNKYVYKEKINDSLYAKFIINNDLFEVNVYDYIDNEEYLPFAVKSATQAYVTKVRDKVNSIISNILTSCFIPINLKGKIFAYVKEKYNTTPIYPWKDDLNSCTFKTNKKNKWYGLLTTISYKKLGLAKEGNIDIINLKNEPVKIDNLIDNEHYFRAYHMNKKYWFTILLDANIDFEKVKLLIDESYDIVDGK